MTGDRDTTPGDAPRDDADPLFNVRMRASASGEHVSGAERIVATDVARTAGRLIDRALAHPRGDPDDVTVTVERLTTTPRYVSALPVVTVETEGVERGRAVAADLLHAEGISGRAIQRGIDVLCGDTAERGAALLDGTDGTRYDPDPRQGVRATRLGTSERGDAELAAALETHGLDSTRIRDALVLATKVVHAPHVRAELCWSDNPDYTAGYVATPDGYYRFPELKPAGSPRGGRAFFLAADGGDDVSDAVTFLRERPVLVDGVGGFSRMDPEAVMERDGTGGQDEPD